MEHSETTTLVRPEPENIALAPDLASAEVSRVPQVHNRANRGPLRRRLSSEGAIVFVVAIALYLVISVLLDFKYKSFPGDAVSRMGNGFYILYSRDAHLAAIGFVWEPLTSFADMVFLLGNHVWPALSHNNMAGSLTSACSMAGAAYQIHAALREWGVTRTPRLALTACFIADPMILFYSGNGMSEGLYLFTLIAATRYLLRWIHQRDLRSLAYAATELGFSYLTRNEAAASVAAGAVAVAVLSYRRQAGDRPARRRTALGDATVFAIPGVVAAVGWAITSYVITGSFFEQYTSVYGSSAQEAHLAHLPFKGRIDYELHAIGTMGPLLVLVLVSALIIAIRRRDAGILAPVTILGGALGFDVLALLNNNIQPYYRYYIVTVPIEILLVGNLLAPRPLSLDDPVRTSHRSIGRKVLRDTAGLLVVLVALAPAFVTTAGAMFSTTIAPEESLQLAFVFDSHLNAADLAWKEHYPTIISIGNYLANLHLPNGDVIVDNSTGCVPGLITSISQPKLFAIPNDRDFQREVADPLTFHAHYILEPDPSQNPVTAENITYPALWKTGDAGFAKRIHQFTSNGACPDFRLFKVLRHPTALH
jgi:hypothetical protein